MSKDVANMIWQIAKKEEDNKNTTLKQMFRKKFQEDKQNLRTKLANLIEEKINTSSQLSSTYLDIPYYWSGHLEIKEIKENESQNSRYIFLNDKSNICQEITNEQAKQLIDYAIIPLDLKWSIVTKHFGEKAIRVFWNHWDKK